MKFCKITYIYGLYEIGKENEIRYIGKTDNPKKRLNDHIHDKKMTSHKSCWIKSVISEGNKIGIKIIAVVNFNNWKEEEIFYIKEYKKTNKLVNITDGGDGRKTNIYNKNLHECKKWLIKNKPNWVCNIKTYKEWSKLDSFPKFLPKAPHRVFNDWIGWSDYLNTNNISTNLRKNIYLEYEDAKKYLLENYKLKNTTDFRKTKIPIFIPKKPYNIYKEWKSWEDFLGYKSNKRIGIKYLDYDSAKKWILENWGRISCKEYREKSKNNDIPIFLPKKPEKTYENFKWSDYLEYNYRKKPKDFYLPFEEARKIARSLKLKNNKEWRKWCKNKSIEFIHVPSSPEQVYKEWVSLYDWLGNL